ncbi:conserved hypothetical protein [Thiomonas arsenitoxydans]|uniref:Uncharacterized protein n=1 Tax=Thiomonas arsenitoxydans (strain DSM 22701 / CIP 110005 / 3As) TaxID=426114 RepID=D6CPY4_THIA3|nr:hypothetical protein THI_1377 [Thiomonas arsenitoxydans]CQR40673.1 conserved hypothetical protein [Thiomonas arsenitoxydans]
MTPTSPWGKPLWATPDAACPKDPNPPTRSQPHAKTVDLSTPDCDAVGLRPRVKIESARWVKIPSARTDELFTLLEKADRI